MRNAAATLGLIAGLISILIGLFNWGAIDLMERSSEAAAAADHFDLFENPQFIRMASLFAPLLIIAGAAMARFRALWGGLAMLVGCAGLYFGFGFNVFTMFPIAFSGVAGVLAILSRQPDTPTAH